MQTWLSIILTICMHSIECTILKDFLLDKILLGHIELKLISDCIKKVPLAALVDTASKNLDKTTLSQMTPSQLMRKAATMRNTQITLSGKTPVELAMGGRPGDLMDPATMNPEQLTSTPIKQDLLNEDFQKLSMKTHSEVQQREDIRRDLAEGRKFVFPDLRVGEQVCYCQENSSKIQQGRKFGKWLKVEIIAVKGPKVVIITGTSMLQVSASKLRRPLDTADLERPPNWCERTGAPVLWLLVRDKQTCGSCALTILICVLSLIDKD